MRISDGSSDVCSTDLWCPKRRSSLFRPLRATWEWLLLCCPACVLPFLLNINASRRGATATKPLFPCHILWTHQAIEAGRVHKAKLQRGLFQCLSGLMCMLGDLRGLVIADFGRERSHEHERAVDQ